MTSAQTIAAIHAFAAIGIGARLYDWLIGRTSLLNGATTIVTLNLRHMRGLFPAVTVLSPAEYLLRGPG